MGIEDLVNISRFLFAAAGLCGITAAVLFFVLDISKCWRMVWGKAPTLIRERKSGRIKTGQADKADMDGECGITVLLGDRTENILMQDKAARICRETGDGMEQTMPLETGVPEMELIQDITKV